MVCVFSLASFIHYLILLSQVDSLHSALLLHVHLSRPCPGNWDCIWCCWRSPQPRLPACLHSPVLCRLPPHHSSQQSYQASWLIPLTEPKFIFFWVKRERNSGSTPPSPMHNPAEARKLHRIPRSSRAASHPCAAPLRTT